MIKLRTTVTRESEYRDNGTRAGYVFVIRDAITDAHLDQYGAPERAHHAAELISQGLTPERARVLTELLCS